MKNRRWGPIAGIIKANANPISLRESTKAALFRELSEESGISPDSITPPINLGVVFAFSPDKLKVGIVFKSWMNSDIESVTEGYQPKANPEIEEVRAFSPDMVFDLLNNPNQVYKQEFNDRLLRYWLFMSVYNKYEPHEGPGFACSVAMSRYGLDHDCTQIFN